ncbi:hypothetical protein ALC62_11601 [Cyphomyrmex costatus]|uniref:Uncharacterized protein n=1 Tax=Cyphomyrmex costatus TaxID=456900 RepID=A0A151IC85_9HYME|nr:hypothetical protein ALC62_11601 [Cyphomyrmex costatus]
MPINFATTCNRAFHGHKIYSGGGCRPGVGGFGLQIRLVPYLAVLHNELRWGGGSRYGSIMQMHKHIICLYRLGEILACKVTWGEERGTIRENRKEIIIVAYVPEPSTRNHDKEGRKGQEGVTERRLLSCDCSYQFIKRETPFSTYRHYNIGHKYACCDISSLRDLNQTNREFTVWSKLITQQHQHRLLPCPIGPTSLTARHSSRGIDRKPLHESAHKPEAYRRAAGCRSPYRAPHTIQETGSGIDEHESELATLSGFLAELADRTLKSFRKRLSWFIIIASRGIQAHAFLTSMQHGADSVVAREISIRVSLC